MTNWDLIKTQFEILGKTKEQICEEHDVSRRVLNHAIEQGTWSAPTAKDDTDDLEHLAQQADILHARHQGDLLVDYITAENSFMKQLISISGDFEDAEEAKKIAETLALIKPVIMKQADNDKGGSGSGRIMIVNQFFRKKGYSSSVPGPVRHTKCSHYGTIRIVRRKNMIVFWMHPTLVNQ